MDGQLILSAGLLTTVTVELTKKLYRLWIKNPDYQFPPWYYETLLPFLTAVWGVTLGVVGLGTPVAFDVPTFINWGLAIVATIFLYDNGLKSFKEYRKRVNGG